jgi:cyclopropane fatty-acyl-phospholipid synthase-like methyltransferase
MITVKTNHPIAIDSLDHIYPEGVYYDNNVSETFVNDVQKFFNKKINFLDLGCAGGALSVRMHELGHKSIGIDGSDGCLNIKDYVIKHFNGNLPLGYSNWKTYVNKILFTADITKNYEILENNQLVKFDLITCWDVMEHFEPNQVEDFLLNIEKHLNPGGIFIASIALFDSGSNTQWEDSPNINYHKSVFPADWWLPKLENHLNTTAYPFSVCNREYIGFNGDSYLLYTGTKK